MTKAEIDQLKKSLEDQLSSLQDNVVSETVSGAGGALADESDRATAESEVAFGLRLKDRNRKLASKITDTLRKIDSGDYGICESCDEEIGFRRLLARPVTTMCIDCKTETEAEEKKTADEVAA